jgi:hypothetical protein
MLIDLQRIKATLNEVYRHLRRSAAIAKEIISTRWLCIALWQSPSAE